MPQKWTEKEGKAIVKCANCGTGYPVSASSGTTEFTEGQQKWVDWFFKHGRHLAIGPMDQLAEPRRSIDLITAFELADCPDPAGLLSNACVMLKRDGLLLIDVPERSTEDLHRWYFTEWGLRWLLEENGFFIVGVEQIDYRIRVAASPQAHVADLRLIVPSGIGDIHWMLTKMEALKEREAPCRLTVVVQAGGENPSDEDRGHIERAREFLELVPFIDAVEFQPGPVPLDKGCLDVLEPTYSWIANHHVDSGARLEEWHPELATNWYYPVTVPDSCRQQARWLRNEAGGCVIAFYMSGTVWNQVTTGAGADWKPKDWASLATALGKQYKCRPLLLGAGWDLQYADDVMRHADPEDFVDLIGKTPFPLAAAVMEQADVIIGMGTGLTMMGVHLGARSIMFWPEEGVSRGRLQFPKKMQTCWVSPDTLKSGRYVPMSLGTFKVEDVVAAVNRLVPGADREDLHKAAI